MIVCGPVRLDPVGLKLAEKLGHIHLCTVLQMHLIIFLLLRFSKNSHSKMLYLKNFKWHLSIIYNSDQANVMGVKLSWGAFYRILQGKNLKILLITSCTPTKFTWSKNSTMLCQKGVGLHVSYNKNYRNRVNHETMYKALFL